jgi:putative flavoprotein involved in K+ transport
MGNSSDARAGPLAPSSLAMEGDMDTKIERHETVIIGGGQAGLAAGYHLTQARRSFVILEAHARIGDSWRKRWDSLRLFTPTELNNLPGFAFPARHWTFPTKDEMADYLERYAAMFDLPVRTDVHVQRLTRNGQRFVIETETTTYEADNVIIATGADRAPRIPDFALDLDPRILQLHSSEYRNPAMLRPGGVLIVGAGNSGAEIALDVARTHRTWLAGRYRRSPGGPSRSRIANFFVKPILLHVLTIDTPIGRRVRGAIRKGGGGAPVERVTLKALAAANVELVPRMDHVQDGRPALADGRVADAANVIWCTGFAPGLEWIDLPIHDERGEARHVRGVVPDVPGLYFVGRPFQYAFISAAVGGVGRDAGYVAKQIVKRAATRAQEVAASALRA